MANWATHIRIAEHLKEAFCFLDERGLCMGSIAPDCNVENEDWTSFTPPREITHFMSGSSKTTADYEGFYARYIQGRQFMGDEEFAFLIGYYAHLATDAAFQRFIRDEQRVRAMIARLKGFEPYRCQLSGMPETHDTVKRVFDRRQRMNDIVRYEYAHLMRHPDGMHQRILLATRTFPDYLAFLPPGAIVRKIGVMGKPMQPMEGESEGLFFSKEEYEDFIVQTTEMIVDLIREKGI